MLDLYRSEGLPEDKLALTGTPYGDFVVARSEFPSYLEMSRAVLRGLADIPATRVTVSLHPAVAAEDRESIATFGVTISDDYVLRLIPANDVYVSYFSSTIRWAIASGKPVLNYDAYKLGLDVYDLAPGVFTTNSQQQLIARARELAGAAATFAQHAAQQVAVANHWGMLDEPAMPRILAELERLAGR